MLMDDVLHLDMDERVPVDLKKQPEEYELPNKITGSIASASQMVWGACKLSAIWLCKTVANVF